MEEQVAEVVVVFPSYGEVKSTKNVNLLRMERNGVILPICIRNGGIVFITTEGNQVFYPGLFRVSKIWEKSAKTWPSYEIIVHFLRQIQLQSVKLGSKLPSPSAPSARPDFIQCTGWSKSNTLFFLRCLCFTCGSDDHCRSKYNQLIDAVYWILER